MILTEELVKECRKMAWNGYKVSTIISKLNLNHISKNSIYSCIIGTTFAYVSDPPPFKKCDLKLKVCTKCEKSKLLDEFVSGYICIKCFKIIKHKYDTSDEKRLKRKQYYLENKEKELKKQKDWRSRNKDYFKNYHKRYYLENKNELLEKCKRYRQTENGKKLEKLRRLKRRKEILNILMYRVSKAIRKILRNGTHMGGIRYLNYSKEELLNHLMKTKPSNLEIKDCHIDHIKPKCSFNPEKLLDPNSDEFKECWSLENLRLISGKDNSTKGYTEDIHLKWKFENY